MLSAWTFATTSYTVSSTNPVYLSFYVGAGYSSNDVDLWQYNGTRWTPYTATDLTYDGTYAAIAGLLAYAWRRRRV